MPPSNSRTRAHESLYPLWEVAEATLHDSLGNEQETQHENVGFMEIKTGDGVTIASYAGTVLVSAELVQFGGDTKEVVEVVFSSKPDDLSESVVSTHWYEGTDRGTETRPLEEVPNIAEKILALIQPKAAA